MRQARLPSPEISNKIVSNSRNVGPQKVAHLKAKPRMSILCILDAPFSKIKCSSLLTKYRIIFGMLTRTSVPSICLISPFPSSATYASLE